MVKINFYCIPVVLVRFWVLNNYRNSTDEKKDHRRRHSNADKNVMVVFFFRCNGLEGVHLNIWTEPPNTFCHGPFRDDWAIDGVLWSSTVPGTVNRAEFCRIVLNLR